MNVILREQNRATGPVGLISGAAIADQVQPIRCRSGERFVIATIFTEEEASLC
jgi:hypothetical protein